MVALLTPVFAEEAEPEEAAQQTETVEENAPAEETHVSDVEDDAVSRAIRDYVTSLGGTHPTPYVKGGMAMAWGCCAFVNLVWLRVFGKDTYDAQPEAVTSGGAVSDVIPTSMTLFSPWNLCMVAASVIITVSDGCMAGIVSHNYEYVSYNYYPGFFSGACALTLYRLPDDMRAKVEPEIPEDFEEDSWSSEPILTAMDQGIMQTNDEGNFLPNRYVSRAMLVEILYCMEGCPSVTGRAFKDVPSNAWYAKAVLWAACNNIISGDDINTFSPDKALSRQDLYGVLYNYARYRNVLPGNAVELDGFLDVGNVPYYDIYPLQWAVGNGLLGGDGGRLYPNSFTTRAQVAQIMTVFKEKAGL